MTEGMNQFPGTWNGDRLFDETTGMASHHPLPPRPEAYFPIDFTNLYLGIDDAEDNSVRAVCLEGGATRFPCALSWGHFKRPAKLLAYVKSCVRDSGILHVAVRTPNRISGPSVFYLEEFEGISVTRISPTETLASEEEWELHVEPGYLDAFNIALTVAYRAAASNVLDDLSQMANADGQRR